MLSQWRGWTFKTLHDPFSSTPLPHSQSSSPLSRKRKPKRPKSTPPPARAIDAEDGPPSFVNDVELEPIWQDRIARSAIKRSHDISVTRRKRETLQATIKSLEADLDDRYQQTLSRLSLTAIPMPPPPSPP